MRKLFLSLLLMGAFATAANAQKEFANIQLPMNRAEDLVTVADKDGNVCIYFYQNGRLNLALLSPNGEQLAQHEIPYRFSQEPQILGTRVTDEEFIFYSRYTNGRREYVRPFALNRHTGAFRSLQDEQLQIARNANFLGGFGNEEHFYMLYTDKDHNLHLYRDNDEDVAHLEHREFKPDMPRTRDRFAREQDLIYVSDNIEHTVFTGHHRSKIYIRGDKIYMIFDGFDLKGSKKNEATTEILALDWATGKTEYRTLPPVEQRNDPSFNSFLFKDRLFRVKLDKDKFKLTAFDFNTLEPIKEYSYSGDEEIAIKSTPVQQRGAGSLFSSNDTKEIEKTSKVLKNLADGVPAITVDAFSDSTLQLTIGSYKAPSDRTNMDDKTRMVRTPDRYVRTSRGLMMVPGRWTPAYTIPSYYLNSPYYSRYFYDPYGQGSYFSSGPGTSTYFRSVLSADNLAKVDSGEDTEVLQEKIEDFEQDLKPEPEFKTVYRYGDKLHYGYYDRKAKTFRIMEFAHGQEPKQQQEPQP